MSHRKLLINALIALVLVTGLVAYLVIHSHAVLAPKGKAGSTQQKPKPQLDPLTIEAMRARSYPASPIVEQQSLSQQAGYSNQIISYTSDGNRVYALQSTPDGAAPTGGWPVIILLHGYINPAQYRTDDGSYAQFIAAFTQAGYRVIKPDYRGNGSSQGVPEGGHFSPVYAYDTLNLIASLKQDKQINPARIGLFGHSLGGHVALRTIVVSKDVKATVFMAGVVGSFYDIFYNWPHSPMPNDQPSAIVQGKKAELIQKYGDPKANPTFWNSVSAINYVDAVSGAVQLNHDEQDSTVPKLFSDHLEAALQKAGKPVDYHTYPGDDHQFSQNRAAILANAVAFYKAHL